MADYLLDRAVAECKDGADFEAVLSALEEHYGSRELAEQKLHEALERDLRQTVRFARQVNVHQILLTILFSVVILAGLIAIVTVGVDIMGISCIAFGAIALYMLYFGHSNSNE
ncbi:MAG: hypothetical protein AAF591_18490 [Verrucomicrobiota bacterium]